MAQETTEVRFRRGTTSENDEFTGAEGEVVVDTTIHTLRVHDGDKEGGYEIALADMTNVNVASLAERTEGDSLMYYDMRNLVASTASEAKKREIGSILTTDYGLAYADTSNINTADLVDPDKHGGSPAGNKPLAYVDMSNVNTVDLATGEGIGGKHVGNDLAYANMSNVNTVNLATSTGHSGDNLAYANGTNINTAELASQDHEHGSPLAYADASNIPETTVQFIVKNGETYRSTEITELANENYHYPTVKAVYDYTTKYQLIDNKIIDNITAPGNNDTYPTTKATVNFVNTQVNSAIAEMESRFIDKNKFAIYADEYQPLISGLADVQVGNNYVLTNGHYYQGVLSTNCAFVLPSPTNAETYTLRVYSGRYRGWYVKANATGVLTTSNITLDITAAQVFTGSTAAQQATTYIVTNDLTYNDGTNTSDIVAFNEFNQGSLNQIEAFIHVDGTITIDWGANYWLDSQEIEYEDGTDLSIVWRYIPTVRTGTGASDWGAWCVSSYNILQMGS